MDANLFRLRQTLAAVAALFIVAGLLTVAAGVRQYRAVQLIGDWPAADGTIQSVEPFRAERRGRSITYFDALRLTYDYTVNGQPYTGQRLRLDGQPTPAESAAGRTLLDRYPPGAPVTVYYDPANPASAVLQRDPPTDVLIAGAGLVGLGLVVAALRLALR
jgi:hypothetical protein